MVDPKSLACSAALCAGNKFGNKMAYSKKFCGQKNGFRIIPLADENTKVIYFERDPYNPKTVVNVLDENKNRIYSFERSPKSKLCLPSESLVPWDFITANHRQIIGAVGAKKEKSWVEFCNKGDMQYRIVRPQKKCICPKYLQFKQYKDDISKYRWARYAMTLDKVTPSCENPCVETRQRVAYARKLSFLKCKSPLKKCAMKSQSKTIIDYEVTYDSTLIDRELLIATAFISMLTQWNKAKQQRSVATSRVSKKAQIKMLKAKAFIKTKRAVTVGALATETKAGMSIDKAKNAKGMLVKFMGGTVPPTVENPTGDPTFTKGRYGVCRPERKIPIPAGIAGCLPVGSCVPKNLCKNEGFCPPPPPDRLSNGCLAKEEPGTCFPVRSCSPVRLCSSARACSPCDDPRVSSRCVIQQPVPIQPQTVYEVPVQSAPVVVPQTSVNVGYTQQTQLQPFSAPIQFNNFGQAGTASLVSGPMGFRPVAYANPYFVRQKCQYPPRFQQVACPKYPYPVASSVAPMRQVFPVAYDMYKCRSAPVCPPRAICAPVNCAPPARPVCRQEKSLVPVGCGLRSQACRIDQPLKRGYY